MLLSGAAALMAAWDEYLKSENISNQEEKVLLGVRTRENQTARHEKI